MLNILMMEEPGLFETIRSKKAIAKKKHFSNFDGIKLKLLLSITNVSGNVLAVLLNITIVSNHWKL